MISFAADELLLELRSEISQMRQGTLGHNALRGFSFRQIALTLPRQFTRERAKLEVRAEFFNALNRPNFSTPRAALSDPLFGAASALVNRDLGSGGAGGGLQPVYQIGGPRAGQLAVRLTF